MSGLLNMVNAGESDFNKLTDAINDSNGAAEEMAKIRNDNLAGDLKSLASVWESLQIMLMEGKASEDLRSFVQTAQHELEKINNSLVDGLSLKGIAEVGKDAVQGLINKTLAFDGVGSVLAGGMLIFGLKKIYNMATNTAKKITSIIELAKDIPKSLPSDLPTNNLPTQTTKELIINAQNVYVNGKNQPNDNIPTPSPNEPNKAPKDKSPTVPPAKIAIWEKTKDILKTGLNYGGDINKANIALTVPIAAYDIYNAKEGEKGAAVARAGGGIAGEGGQELLSVLYFRVSAREQVQLSVVLSVASVVAF